MSNTATPTWTDAELMTLPDDGRYEVVDGELLHTSPASARHGEIVARLLARIHAFVTEHRLGHVFDGQTGFRLPGGNLRSPDASFVASERLPHGVPEGFLHLAPDLAVEVLSPTDRPADVAHKVGEYLGVGVRLLWVLDPETRAAVAYRPGTTPRSIRLDAELDGEDILPGFSVPVRTLLEQDEPATS